MLFNRTTASAEAKSPGPSYTTHTPGTSTSPIYPIPSLDEIKGRLTNMPFGGVVVKIWRLWGDPTLANYADDVIVSRNQNRTTVGVHFIHHSAYRKEAITGGDTLGLADAITLRDALNDAIAAMERTQRSKSYD